MRQDSSFPLARRALVALASLLAVAVAIPAPATAKDKTAKSDAKSDSAKADAKGKSAKTKEADDGAAAEPTDKKSKKGDKSAKDGGKPEALGSFGDWNAYATNGRDKTCYALGAPKERSPKAKLKDTSANIFISTRPGEGVKNEVAINLGYATKDGGSASADIDGDEFELVTKGTNAWVKNPAKEKEFVESLKGGSKLVVKAASAKGTTTTDTYSLKGLSDALGKVAAECR